MKNVELKMQMDGLLIIDKPAGITSHDVVNRVRRVLKTKRVGHTGTLDPFATGVMVVLIGKATRLAQFLDKDEKEYEAVIRFGFETNTGDLTGSAKSEVQNPKPFSVDDIERVLPEFRGKIKQTPPMYSAKKVAGKKLYELARKGQEVEREAVPVTIHELGIIDGPDMNDVGTAVRIRVVCSAGTYIRTLAQDIGRVAGHGAHLTELRRIRAGRFSIDQAVSLEALEALSDPCAKLLPVEYAVEHLAEFLIREDRVEKTRNGMSTRAGDDQRFANDEPIKMVTAAGELIAIGFFDASENSVRPKVVLG